MGEPPVTDRQTQSPATTRRRFLRATGAMGAVSMGVGTATAASREGRIESFEQLTVGADNRLVTESGDPVVLRGLNVPDPKRADYTAPIRGKDTDQIIDLVTDTTQGWYPRAIRIPAQPVDIGEHRIGADGPVWEASELTNPDAVDHDEGGSIVRRKQVPPPVPAFDRPQLDTYVSEHLRPAVECCRERGVYCIVAYNRHWHEQPPGTNDFAGAENHLPYDSDYTCYWAYNDHEAFGTSEPASFRWVDQKTITDLTEKTGWTGWESMADARAGNPYEYDHWQVNRPLLEEAKLFWEVVGAAFADEPHVIFEPFGTPTAPALPGPVEGCGGWKQRPLWRTFQDQFMGPLIEAVRTHHPDRVVIAGLPGWSLGTQGLHWRNFREAGYENVAIGWQTDARTDASQLHNWVNDTSYESYDTIEAHQQAAGDAAAVLCDPSFDPALWPNGGTHPDGPACWGWERYEATGLQNAMAHHPVVVTAFGWRDSDWWPCSDNRPDERFGLPFLDAVGEDDRISWMAWSADVRWLPTMFDVDWAVADGGVALTDHNWYETDLAALGEEYTCPDLPCDWELRDRPAEGQIIKDVLAERATDRVPLPLERGPDWPAAATDPDGDGLYEDLNGDDEVDFPDVNRLFQHRDRIGGSADTQYYDFTGDGSVNLQDVIAIFRSV